jgi:hypothetical protein
MPKQIYAIFALILAALACNWADIVPPAAPVIEPSPLPTFAIPSITPSPTETPLPTPTSTPDAPIAWAGALGVNCRYGPGKEWEVVSTITEGTIAEIKGRTINTAWWLVKDPLQADTFCWVSYDVMETAGNMDIIPIAEAPEALITNVTADAVVTFTACGGTNEVALSGSATTNGPTTVTYHWEVRGDAQHSTSDETITITEMGTHELPLEIYAADCGNYTLRLLITSPDEVSVDKAFNIQAP